MDEDSALSIQMQLLAMQMLKLRFTQAVIIAVFLL